MPKELYLKIDDDVARTVAKISRARSADLTLVFPKGAMVLSNVINLKLLKKQIDLLDKKVTILTNDQSGQRRALEAGFDLMTFEMMRQGIGPIKHSVPKQSKPEEERFFPPIFVPKPVPLLNKEIYREEQPIQPEIPKRYPANNFNLPGRPANGKKAWFFTLLLSVILVGLAVLILLPEAKITIYAHIQPVSRDLQIVVNKNAKNVDSKNLIFPGSLLDRDEQFSKTYTATGKQDVGIKAQGLVQFYNYTGKTLKFSAKTTTLTLGNNIYRVVNDVGGIKPTKNFLGTSTPDPATLSKQVSIIADQPGDAYNAPAGSRFEIHNYVLGDEPNKLYAETTAPIEGGISKFMTTITQGDLDNAKSDLRASVLSYARSEILNKEGLVLLDSGAQFETTSVTFDKQANDGAVSFNGQVSGHLKAILFVQSQLEDLVKQRIDRTLNILEQLDSSRANWSVNFKNTDFIQGQGTLAVKYKGIVESKVDPKEIEAKSRGKGVGDLKEILLSDPKIDGADIVLKPFWAKSLPSLSGRIKVEVTTKQ
ncbi:MAG: hypothetical protein NVSMB66_7250 [Candidatus Doudnabacteria bacterium]